MIDRSTAATSVALAIALASACQPSSVIRDPDAALVDAAARADRALADALAHDAASRDSGPGADRRASDLGSGDGVAVDRAAADGAVRDRAVSDTARPDSAVADAAPPHVCSPSGPLDCSPGSGTGNADQCFDGPSCYYNQVRAAVNGTIASNPSWFEHSDTYSCEIVLDVENYMNGVVSWLVGDGLCAIRDPNAPGEEITVKHDNAFSENFDILASTGCARSGAATYTGYCAPAWW